MEMKRLCKKYNLWAADTTFSVTTALRCASQNCGSELCHHSMSVRLMPSTRQSRDNRCSFFKALPSFPIVLSLPFPLFRQYQPVSASFSSSRALPHQFQPEPVRSIPTRTSVFSGPPCYTDKSIDVFHEDAPLSSQCIKPI